MPRLKNSSKSRLIETVVAQAKRRVTQDTVAEVESFIRQYYGSVAEEDLRERKAVNLCGAALAHLAFARVRKPKSPRIRLYNPIQKNDGWDSSHTVVEMVNDDMPFLVDSLAMVLSKYGLSIHLTIHPVINVCRDARGRLKKVLAEDESARDVSVESFLHIELDRENDPEILSTLQGEIIDTMADVRAAVNDWKAMRQKARGICQTLESDPPPLTAAEIDEVKTFLKWMEDNHFTFLGYREYRLISSNSQDVLSPFLESGLGILRKPGNQTKKQGVVLPKDVHKRVHTKELLIVTKANSLATVHRYAYLDYIGVKVFDKKGAVIGEKRFLGLFTSGAYNRSPREIPLLRHKVEQVMAQSRLPSTSHAGKALLHILETLPRDELFQSTTGELYTLAMGILHLQERQRVKLFIRRDAFGRFFSCLVYVPRDHYNTQIRNRIEGILKDSLRGTSVESTVQLAESVLARAHFIVRTTPWKFPTIKVSIIEKKIIDAIRPWGDLLRDTLVERLGEERGLKLFRRYGNAFSAAYVEEVSPRAAALDIVQMEALEDEEKSLRMSLYHSTSPAQTHLHFKIFRRQQPIPIFEVLPMLENMGLQVISEQPYEVELGDTPNIWIQDFTMRYGQPIDLKVEVVREIFQDTFAKTWWGEVESDGFNKLVLGARLTWRQTTLLRAYCKYLLQTGTPFSQAYMERALWTHPQIARLLITLFETRFDPSLSKVQREREGLSCAQELNGALDSVASLDNDRILRAFLAVIQASLRTNYYQEEADGTFKPYLSFKLDPGYVPDLPLPRPKFEIFVYSPRVEGLHLRGGKVARGGLRWSDRREDFRTEVLGLMKAQLVKNTLIVPVGAKGGFVVKCLPQGDDREKVVVEVVECYRSFIRGLLDITDNFVEGKVVVPEQVVRYDEDDPYLVVAADKGTATFSDIANAVAKEYNFWLGDAFASGGSVGYDHKKMGITARGAWESVKRLFRERGVDIEKTAFSVAGIGDMSGDVFGNGMLQSLQIKLQAAFNHMHIFLDPNPDPAASYRERKRLFKLPRSTWDDYKKSLISKGGGVFSRQVKQIGLSPEAKALLAVEANTMTPPELIRAILRMPVDLLWNGGIGTYFKASRETSADVGDRTNDQVRINANEMRCKVVGEGGNLGFTQSARIEYALKGGRINTDFIDNSGGVNCSDREVNIKILLNVAKKKRPLSPKRRDELLLEMTDEVASLVLQDNYLQSQAISMMESQAVQRIKEYAYLIRILERNHTLDRNLEFLPSDEEVANRKKNGQGLTRPELAVLLAYSKIALYNDLLATDLPEDPYLAEELERYFPQPLHKPYHKLMTRHPLRRQIIAMHITNSMVNRMGPTFVYRMKEETGADAADVARAYTVAREAFAMRPLWASIEALDNKVPASIQYSMTFETSRGLKHVTRWLLQRPSRSRNIAAAVSTYEPGIATLMQTLPQLLTDPARHDKVTQRFIDEGVPESIARCIASRNMMYAVLDMVEVAREMKAEASYVASIYFTLGTCLALDWLRDQIENLAVEGHWHAVARGILRENLYRLQRVLVAEIIVTYGKKSAGDAVTAWKEAHRDHVAQLQKKFIDMKTANPFDFATLLVALQEIHKLT